MLMGDDMRKDLFRRCLSDAQRCKDYSEFYDKESFQEVIKIICDDIGKTKYFTFDGRFEDIVYALLKNPRYQELGYDVFIEDLQNEFKKLVTTNVFLLPINFLRSSEIKHDLVIDDDFTLFLPTENDLKNYTNEELYKRQQKHKNDTKNKYYDNLSKYFEKKLNQKLDKEHILLVKDGRFFNYPILAFTVDNIDRAAERESGRIAEATYSFLRMIDFKYRVYDYSHGLLSDDWLPPAHSYVVYYNNVTKHKFVSEESYYGHSFMYNFSEFLDVSTKCFIEHKDRFAKLTKIFIEASFIDEQLYSITQIDLIRKWSNAILMFNSAYEFASIEKYDSCALLLCSILESFFLKNEGRNKQNRLVEEVSIYFNDLAEAQAAIDDIVNSIKSVYKYRNSIIHEGVGYENKFVNSRRIGSAQGIYRGMRPFYYGGATYPHDDILQLEKAMSHIVEIIIGDKTVAEIDKILHK